MSDALSAVLHLASYVMYAISSTLLVRITATAVET
jgi:hypothetical protein